MDAPRKKGSIVLFLVMLRKQLDAHDLFLVIEHAWALLKKKYIVIIEKCVADKEDEELRVMLIPKVFTLV